MSNFEVFLIIMACAVPFVAFLMVLPKIKIKLKKKDKKVTAETKSYAQIKAEELPKVEEKPKDVALRVSSNDLSADDFKSYLKKRKPTTRPSRMELPADFKDRTMPYMPRRRRFEKKPQSVAEEINNLSPELKAMLIAGVLDKKDFN